MWFVPWNPQAEPSVEQLQVDKTQRTNKLFPLVSNSEPTALKIKSDAKVYSCFLKSGHVVTYEPKPDWGSYLYVLEGGSMKLNDKEVVPELGAAMISEESTLKIATQNDTETLLVAVKLT